MSHVNGITLRFILIDINYNKTYLSITYLNRNHIYNMQQDNQKLLKETNLVIYPLHSVVGPRIHQYLHNLAANPKQG